MAQAATALSAESALGFGVFPYVTPQRLVKTMAPLRDLLSDVTGRPVELQTGPDYRAFHEQALRGDFDFVLTSAYLGRDAARRSQLHPLVLSRYQASALFVVSKDSPVRRMADLGGRILAVPDPLSTLYNMAASYLRHHGLEPGRDVKLRIFNTNQNSLGAPLRGDADAGVTGYTLWLTGAPRERLRIIAQTPKVPGFMLLANQRLDQATVDRVRSALLQFDRTEAGKRYFSMTRHEAWIAVDEAKLKPFDDFPPVR